MTSPSSRVGLNSTARVPDPREIAALGGATNPVIARLLARNPWPAPNRTVPLFDPSPNLFATTREPAGTRVDPDRLHEELRERLTGYGGLIAEVLDSLAGPQGIVYSPIEERSLCLPDFSLNCVMRSSQPSLATQLNTQASSAWTLTCD